MNFVVVDRWQVQRGVAIDHPYIVISITDPEMPEARIRADGLCRAVFRFRFHDAEPGGRFADPETIVLMMPEDAREIWSAVQQHRDHVETILVHCEAGISRSPAVAAAICRALGQDDSSFFRDYQPNRHVYRLVLQAAGVQAGEGCS